MSAAVFDRHSATVFDRRLQADMESIKGCTEAEVESLEQLLDEPAATPAG